MVKQRWRIFFYSDGDPKSAFSLDTWCVWMYNVKYPVVGIRDKETVAKIRAKW